MSVVSNQEIFVPTDNLPRSQSQEQLLDYGPAANKSSTSDSTTPSAPPGRALSFAVVYFSIFVDMLGFSLIFPSLPKVAKDFGANGFMMGVINAAYSTAQMFCSLICGVMSDHCGRRPLICFCLLGSAFSLTAMGFVTSLNWLIAVRAMGGAMSATIGVAQAYIADQTKPHERAKFMGIVGAASGAGVVLGPGIGGVIQQHWNFKITCFVGAAISLCNFIFAVMFLKESKAAVHHRRASTRGSSIQGGRKSRSIVTSENPTGKDHPKYSGSHALIVAYRRNPQITYVILAFFLAQLGWTAFQTMFAYYAMDKFGISAGQLGMIFTGFGVAVILTQVFLTNPSTKFLGEKWTTVFASILRAGGLFAMVYMPSVLTMILCVSAVAISGSLINPCLNALVSHFSDKHTHGGIMGLNQLMGAFARGVAPLVCGYIYDINKDWTFKYFGSISMALCALVMIPMVTPKKKTSKGPSHGKLASKKSKSSRHSARPQRPIEEDNEAYNAIRDTSVNTFEDEEVDSDEEELYRHAITRARRSSDPRGMV